MTPASQFTSASARAVTCRRMMISLLMTGFVIGALAGCSHNPDRRKKRREKHRDPVEQKVFYNGWGLDRR